MMALNSCAPNMRPFIKEREKMFRWYDYWAKGIDNGVMDEPAGSRSSPSGWSTNVS